MNAFVITDTALSPVKRRLAIAVLAVLTTLLASCAAPPKKPTAPLTPEIAYLAHDGWYWQVWVMDRQGGQQRQITRTPYDKSRISWYADGHRLLVAGTQGELVTIDLSSGQETPIQVTPPGSSDAVISPDGQLIAFSVRTAGTMDSNDLWLVSAQGGHANKLTRMKKLQHDPLWSFDGQWIYFTSSMTGQTAHDIWRISVDGKTKEQLTAGELFNFDVSLASSGELAFSSNRSGNYELWIRHNDGSASRLTDNPALDAHPSWNPEATELVFESSRGGGVPNLWKLKVPKDTSQPVPQNQLIQLTQHDKGARAPVWRRNVENTK